MRVLYYVDELVWASGGSRSVDRLWPRGLTKGDARLDEWLREIAPSNELRKWFGHAPERWPEFVTRFRQELAEPTRAAHIERLRTLAADRTVMLLYARGRHCRLAAHQVRKKALAATWAGRVRTWRWPHGLVRWFGFFLAKFYEQRCSTRRRFKGSQPAEEP